MSAQSYAATATFLGTSMPKVGNQPDSRNTLGNVFIVAFLLAQCFDGIFTYIGVLTYGTAIEANPVITTLMTAFGLGPALAGAKIVAGVLGMCLHLRQVHGAVALLSLFYLTAAILPWSVILFF
jgi:hypothetical protein